MSAKVQPSSVARYMAVAYPWRSFRILIESKALLVCVEADTRSYMQPSVKFSAIISRNDREFHVAIEKARCKAALKAERA